MNSASLFVIFWTYSLFVYSVKRCLYPREALPTLRPREPWLGGKEIAIIVSPDYWWARRFKYRLQTSASRETRAFVLKRFVISNNSANVVISIAIALFCFCAKTGWPDSMFFRAVAAFAWIRLISRSWEITYAFGSDVLQTRKSSTGLLKEERIRLALLSYFEIYVYSSAAYTALPGVSSFAEAIVLSLNVGTLTNVGYVYTLGATSSAMNIVYVQVFTTLSLVVLSLAAYLGRKR